MLGPCHWEPCCVLPTTSGFAGTGFPSSENPEGVKAAIGGAQIPHGDAMLRELLRGCGRGTGRVLSTAGLCRTMLTTALMLQLLPKPPISGLLEARGQAEAIDWGGEGETGGKVSRNLITEYECRSGWWHVRADIPPLHPRPECCLSYEKIKLKKRRVLLRSGCL